MTTQLELSLPPMHAMSLFCKIDGKLLRWDTHCADPIHAIRACYDEVQATVKGKHGVVLGLIRTPIANP